MLNVWIQGWCFKAAYRSDALVMSILTLEAESRCSEKEITYEGFKIITNTTYILNVYQLSCINCGSIFPEYG